MFDLLSLLEHVNKVGTIDEYRVVDIITNENISFTEYMEFITELTRINDNESHKVHSHVINVLKDTNLVNNIMDLY